MGRQHRLAIEQVSFTLAPATDKRGDPVERFGSVEHPEVQQDLQHHQAAQQDVQLAELGAVHGRTRHLGVGPEQDQNCAQCEEQTSVESEKVASWTFGRGPVIDSENWKYMHKQTW